MEKPGVRLRCNLEPSEPLARHVIIQQNHAVVEIGILFVSPAVDSSKPIRSEPAERLAITKFVRNTFDGLRPTVFFQHVDAVARGRHRSRPNEPAGADVECARFGFDSKSANLAKRIS